ncbi:MAG: hypothetical protein CMJ50_06940 [Planctomycetaceae bacterium]|nr:hypothetical protein [Planctomycetaceae bacterium]
MSITRRQFLSRNAAGLSLVALGSNMVPELFASAAAAEVRHQDRILVLVELTGGNDGLNTVIPFDNPAYHRARPELAIREETHRLSDQFALHPTLGELAELFKEGQAAIVHGVGYPSPNRSHFRSMEIWQTAQPDVATAKHGWLGRFLDGTAAQDKGKLTGIAFSERLPRSLLAGNANIPAVGELESYGVFVEGEFDVGLKRRLIEKLSSPSGPSQGGDSAVDFLKRQARNTYIGAKELRTAAERFQPKGEYEGPLGRQLRMAAQVIAADLGTRVIHVSLDGFDTHANQPGQHAELLAQLNRGVSQFLHDVKELGRANDVMMMSYSEFGRRVNENGSHGTDHGAAAPMFLFGNKLKPGFHGEHPSLSELGDGDLNFSTDFRSLYQAVLEDWFGTKAVDVLGAEFPKLALIEGGTGGTASGG